MNEFLLDLGFSRELINNIIKINGENTYADLCFNAEDATNIINYLKEIGIQPIEELLIYKIDIFFMNLIAIKGYALKKKINELVDLVNEDFSNIDLLFKEN